MGPRACPPKAASIVASTLSFLLLSCSQPGEVVGHGSEPLPRPKGIALHFNHRDSSRYRHPLTGEWRNGDNLEQALIAQIKSAEHELLVAVQELSLPAIAEALVQASQNGVKVHVVLENTYSTPWTELHPTDLPARGRQRLHQLQKLADRNRDGQLSAEERMRGDAVAILKRGGVPIIDDTEDGSRGSGLMHHKFIVVDQRRVVTGSANFTSSGLHGDVGAPNSRGNVNHLLSIDSMDLAAIFREEFELMWGDGPSGLNNSRFGRGKERRGPQVASIDGIRVEVLFPPHSPQDPEHGLNLIGRTLAKARQTIDMALFVFSAQSLTDVLAERHNAGVAIRLLADPGFASRFFSEVLDLLGLALPDRFCKLEAGNQPLTTPLKNIGTPRLARGDKLHHKFAVIDNKTVITGSFNWSPSAAHTNDETLLVIHSPKLAAHFTREMNRMWRSAELGITLRMQRKFERQQALCGSGEQRGEITSDP